MREVILNSILVGHVALILMVLDQRSYVSDAQKSLLFQSWRAFTTIWLNLFELKLIIPDQVLVFATQLVSLVES